MKTKISIENVFRVDNSFAFTAQIPDNSKGCTGSRCANCLSESLPRKQMCSECEMPFVGPLGFPEVSEWVLLTPEEKEDLIFIVFTQGINRGRLTNEHVADIPLTQEELLEIERLEGVDAEIFHLYHEIHPFMLSEILI